MALQEPEEFEDDYVILSDIEPDTELNFNTPRVSFAAPLNSTGDEEGDSDLDDIEEIEYGYDNDTLLIMPAMLRDYSHHATNYHPELWRAPIPGSFPPETLQARCRQEGNRCGLHENIEDFMGPRE
ncbi:hypothetical protein BGZ79_006691 [Entomortierella chlamydospora]|nr:hypothetical protein BGZ79_006691 [Entomortierella chlamydospora]